MIDPLALHSRTLEACLPAAERAEKRVAGEAVECPATTEERACTRCHCGPGCWDLPSQAATNQRAERRNARLSAQASPPGQAAVVVPFGAATGQWGQ